ncbi:MAG: hypothetical protein ACRD1S_08165 [Vicinamibacterales bacterium]
MPPVQKAAVATTLTAAWRQRGERRCRFPACGAVADPRGADRSAYDNQV